MSSRTATSRVSSMPATRAMPARARSSGPTRSAGRSGSARSTTRARRASSTAAWSGIPSRTTRFHARCGTRSRATPSSRGSGTRRSWTACSTTSRCSAPAVRCSIRRRFAVKFDQVINTAHRASFYVNREWRTAQQFARRPLRSAARLADEPVPAPEHSQLDDQGVGELGDQRSAAASLRVRLQPLRRTKTGASISTRAGPRRSACGTSRTRPSRGSPSAGRRSWAMLGNFGSIIARRELRGQHDRSGRSDLHHRTPQHQDRLRGALLLRRQRNRRRDGHLQLQLGADEPAGVRSDRPATPTRASSSAPSQTSSRPVQAVNTDYFQRDFGLYVQDDFKVSSKLTLNLGVRWDIVPGFYEKNGYVTNLDLTLPNAAAGNRPGALRFADQEGRKTFIDTYYGAVQPRLGVAYAVSPKMALSGGYSVEPPRRRRRTAAARTSAASTRPATTAISPSTGTPGRRRTLRIRSCILNDPYPSFAGTLPNYDPTQLNNQGFGQLITGNEARREKYHNYNVTLRRQLPANFSMTLAYIGAQGTRPAVRPGQRRQPAQPDSVRRRRTLRRPAVQQPLEPAAARHPAALSRLHRHGAAGAAAVPAVHRHHVSEQLPGEDPVQLAADDARASLQQGSRAGRRLHVVQDRRQLPQAGCVRRGVGISGRRPALPAFPEADLDLRAADRARQGRSTSTACSGTSSAAGRSPASTTTAAAAR